MPHSTLVVSDPPHEEVDFEEAAKLLGLDVFAAGLKAKFPAPEILGAGGPDSAVQLAVALRRTGLRVTILQGSALAEIPWPAPVTHLVFDEDGLQFTVDETTRELGYGVEVMGVVCRPPEKFSIDRKLDLAQALASGHPPTVAEALQWRSFLDLYSMEEGSLLRTTIVPEMFGSDGTDLLTELGRRFRKLRFDHRLAGVWPRARFVKRAPDEDGEDGEDEAAASHPSAKRRGYSFGTERLTDLLDSISQELEMAPQYELGSRMAYALHPLGGDGLEG